MFFILTQYIVVRACILRWLTVVLHVCDIRAIVEIKIGFDSMTRNLSRARGLSVIVKFGNVICV